MYVLSIRTNYDFSIGLLVTVRLNCPGNSNPKSASVFLEVDHAANGATPFDTIKPVGEIST